VSCDDGITGTVPGGDEKERNRVNTNSRLKALIAGLFTCDVSQLTDDVGPGDIPGWDSLGHVTLMAAIRQEFGTDVPVEEAIEVGSIADLAAILDRLGTSS
jgi:acyl carrier protein